MTQSPETSPDPVFLTALRAFIYAVAAFVLLYGLSLGSGLIGGVLGAALSVVAARWMEGRRVRAAAVGLAAVGAVAMGAAADGVLTGSAALSGAIGIEDTLALVDLVVFGLTLFGAGLGLRSLATRVPALAVLEVGVITAGVVRLVAGHRDHAISEPRFLSDWVWSQGGDPIVALLALGALVMATVPLLLMVRQRWTKAALSISVLIFLGLFAFALLRVSPPESMPPSGGLGLTGDPDKQDEPMEGEGGGAGHGGGKGDPNEMPFRDDYPKGEPKPVAVVLLHDDYTSPTGYLYFRQTAFSQYNGTRLVRALVKGADPDLLDRFAARRAEVDEVGMLNRRFERLETTVALITDHRSPFGLNNPVAFESIPNPNPGHFRRAYKVESLAPRMDYREMLDYTAGDPEWPEALRALYTQAPEDPRYEELAKELVAELSPEYEGSPVAQALAIRRWLEKNTVYTRRSNHAGAADPTASFLFGSRRGYCVHLAHSMAYLLRARGLPARVAAGYLVDEARRQSGSAVLIQNQDAHAWAEVYLEGAGWVVMDVSPEQAEEGEGTPINPDLQRVLGELARGDETAGKQVDHEGRASLWRWALGVMAPLLGLLLGLLYGVKAWRRLIGRLSPQGQLYRVLYRRALDQLSEVGLSREYGETREAFAARVAQVAPALEPMTRAHLRRALGGEDRLSGAQWRALSQDIDAQIVGSAPRWRRLLGLVNPVSWMRVR